MKVKFDYQEWLKDTSQKIVNEKGHEVYAYDFGNEDRIKHCVIIDGKVYNMDSDNVPIYFQRYDPSDDSVRNTKVSEDAEEFQRATTTYEKKLVMDCINWFISMSGIFGHYAFFTKELWRKVPGFKKADKAEVIAAFLHWWVRYEYGFQNYPAGMCWSSDHPTSYDVDDECFNEYIEKYKPVFKAYTDWQYKQR